MNDQLQAALTSIRDQIAKLQTVEASLVRVLRPKRRGRPPKAIAAVNGAPRKRGRPRKEQTA